MKSSEKDREPATLDLEADLPVSPEDLSAQKRLSCRPNISLDEYIDFLEQIGAFETRKSRPIIFSEVFSL